MFGVEGLLLVESFYLFGSGVFRVCWGLLKVGLKFVSRVLRFVYALLRVYLGSVWCLFRVC